MEKRHNFKKGEKVAVITASGALKGVVANVNYDYECCQSLDIASTNGKETVTFYSHHVYGEDEKALFVENANMLANSFLFCVRNSGYFFS